MNKIKVTFLLYEDEDNNIDWTSGKVELLDCKDIYICGIACQEAEVLINKADLKEIQKESRGNDGFFKTYVADTLEEYKDGNETKYMVKTWNIE